MMFYKLKENAECEMKYMTKNAGPTMHGEWVKMHDRGKCGTKFASYIGKRKKYDEHRM